MGGGKKKGVGGGGKVFVLQLYKTPGKNFTMRVNRHPTREKKTIRAKERINKKCWCAENPQPANWKGGKKEIWGWAGTKETPFLGTSSQELEKPHPGPEKYWYRKEIHPPQETRRANPRTRGR